MSDVPDGITEMVKVICATCGKLGEYYVTPHQHLEGARERAMRVTRHHPHVCAVQLWRKEGEEWKLEKEWE